MLALASLIVEYHSSNKDNIEACMGFLGIQDIYHFTLRDMRYYPFYFQGYGILCSIIWLVLGILNIDEN